MSQRPTPQLTQEDVARLVQEAELLRSVAQNLQTQITLLSRALREIELAKEVLSTLRGVEGEQEILVPLGASTFIRAYVRNCSRVLIGVGANYVLEEDVGKVMEILDRRREELEKNLQATQMNLARVLQRLSQIESTLEQVRTQLQAQTQRGSS